jgi:uncharacterized protein YeaO (DUF488 family)
MKDRHGAMSVKMKRAYASRSPDDGMRVLIDRLWPRGLSKEAAAVDLWLKDVAPSSALRKWFGHDPCRWQEFRRRYLHELQERDGPLAELRALARRGPLTLVYSAHDELHNDAVVLLELLVGSTDHHKEQET